MCPGIIICNMIHGCSMKSQKFLAIGVALVASVLVVGLASTIYAQFGLASTIYAQSNMTGGNMTGGNMTGGNMTGGNMSMPSASGGDGGGDGDDGGDGGGDDGGDGGGN
jgi:hypothetical protein